MLGDIASIATMVGAAAAILALVYAAQQIHQNTLVARGQFWLELEKMFYSHDEVHLNLRPGGKWAGTGAGPDSPQEWAKLEDYMGLFEHCEVLLGKGLIDRNTFSSIFAYRLTNILANPRIVEAKLGLERESWTDFVKLLERLGAT